ncbi:MAG TPA: PQQ-binding-like beta-propeller repeat protein [Micromonosporaceae bacterium]|nr:PQQ-binding-like beta-propeller repeat protein [Micromonosporaceae bacterium]
MTAQPEPRGFVIDLGEDHGQVPDHLRGPAQSRAWRWIVERLRIRRAIALATAVLLVLAVGGAAVLPGAPLRLVARVAVAAGASIMIDRDRMIVLGDGATVTAYAVPGGDRQWRADLGMVAEYGSMSVSEGVVLVSRDQQGSGDLATEAIDEATGRVLWTSPAQMFATLTGTGTVLMQPNGDAQVQLVALRTGVPRWSMSISGCEFAFHLPDSSVPDAFALLCRDGTLRVVTLPSGSIRSIELPAYSPDLNAFGPQMVTAGGMLIVERWNGVASTVIEGRRWTDSTRVWIRPGFGGQDILFPCDNLKVCVSNMGIGVALEPTTGAEAGPPRPEANCCDLGNILVPPGERATVLLVPAGRTAPAPPPRDVTVLQTQPEKVSHSLQPFLIVQGNRQQSIDRPPQVRLSLVEVVTADGGVRPLQRLPGINATLCTAVATYLICPTAAGQVTVWQYPTD